jgi:mannosyltransferase OCH1-like enzyme
MNITIPKYLCPRKDICIKNYYHIIGNNGYIDDFFIVIYYLNKNKAKIIVRRLDDECGWSLNLIIKVYSYNTNNYENISLGSSESNSKIIEIYTNIFLEPDNYDNEQNIPKRIIQTYKNTSYKSILHYNAVQTFIELNPEYEYYFFDDYDCREFIKNNFNTDVLRSYDSLYPGAFKADLFRYCYIYINGGCYFDNKYILRIPLRELIKINYNNIYCKDRGDDLMFNSTIMGIKNLPEIKCCIDNIVENVNNNFYGHISLSITGPHLFNKYTHNKNILLKHYSSGNEYRESYVKIENTNVLFCNTHYKGYYYNPNAVIESYENLYRQRLVYYKNYRIINNYRVMIFPTEYNDIFDFIINDNQLEIIRKDIDEGWGQLLKIKMINNDNHNERIIEIGNSPNNNYKITVDSLLNN